MPNDTLAAMNNAAPNAESYTDNGDGTVTDEVTHLMWQQASSASGGAKNDGNLTWDEAKAYCIASMIGGHHDWRLPSLIELISIVDYSIGTPGPTINAAAFPGVGINFLGSATELAGTPSEAWYVYLYEGNLISFTKTQPGKSLCVR
jgi:hypothetical protein